MTDADVSVSCRLPVYQLDKKTCSTRGFVSDIAVFVLKGTLNFNQPNQLESEPAEALEQYFALDTVSATIDFYASNVSSN